MNTTDNRQNLAIIALCFLMVAGLHGFTKWIDAKADTHYIEQNKVSKTVTCRDLRNTLEASRAQKVSDVMEGRFMKEKAKECKLNW